MMFIFSCILTHLQLKVIIFKEACRTTANTAYFKYIQYIIVAFIFSPGYNSASEAFQSYS